MTDRDTEKLSYEPPELRDLGSLEQLTAANAGSGDQYDGAGYSPGNPTGGS
jgi:hypothetical protein